MLQELQLAWARLAAEITRIGDRFRELYGVLMLIRFSILLGGAAAVIFLFVPQGQEIILGLGTSFGHDLGRKFAFALGILLAAFSTWYCARVMYRFRFDDPASNPDCLPGFKKHAPRWLGAMVPFTVVVALVRASLNAGAPLSLYILSGFFFFIAALFLWFVYKRRDLLSALGLVPYDQESRNFRSLEELGRLPNLYFKASFALYLVALVVFAYGIGHARFAPFIGPGAVVLLAFGLLIPLGTALVYFGQRYKVSVLTLVLLWAIALSIFVDNHMVRRYPAMRSYHSQPAPEGYRRPLASYRSLAEYYKNWSEDLPAYSDGEVPVYVVAAEGGGIRAAYWTALVLCRLQDRNPAFSRHLLGISGVSGGSLGGAVFSALTKQDAEGTYVERAQNILGRDFLSPPLAVMLFPDLLQRFTPVAWLDDRAMALEEAWEQAWDAHERGRLFGEPFEDLWREDPFRTPLLYLNSTVVETGQRLIASPIPFRQRDSDSAFHDAIDAATVLGPQIPLSTAVHMSARFTYVSPAGTIDTDIDVAKSNGDLLDWIRVVDGGYFENSGAVTAGEIFRVVRDAETDTAGPVKPIVIHIRNEPVPPNGELKSGRWTCMGEVLSPLLALLNVRPARGYQAREQLEAEVSTYIKRTPSGNEEQSTRGLHVFFDLEKKDVTLPLGWMLSLEAQEEMNRQLDTSSDKIERLLAPLANTQARHQDP